MKNPKLPDKRFINSAEVPQRMLRQGKSNYSIKHLRVLKRASWFLLCLALICLGLLFSTTHPVVQAKKASAGAGQSGEIQIQGTPVKAASSATVEFAELAAQEALNPASSEFTPRAINPPKTIIEVDDGTIAPQAPAAVGDDIPGPLVPSPAPSQNYLALEDGPAVGTGFFTIPPDTMGAVGPDSVNRNFVTLNNNYRVQNKATGAPISTVSMNTFWASTGATGAFDPRVQYDPYNDRWIVAAVSNSQSANTSILVGVSLTNDPGGAYFLFRFNARIATDPAAVNFADFPMLGFNKNYVVVSINMFSNTFSDGRVLVLDYPQLRTNVVGGTYFTGISAANGGFSMHPATTFSATENTEYLVSHLSSAGATYKLSTITGPANPATLTIGATMTRPGGGWTQPGGNILPQAQGTCTVTPMRIESGDAFIRSNVVFRNGSIWYPQTVGLPAGGLTRTAAQWTQLDTAGVVVQGGRVDDPTATATNGGIWYNYPSISVNANNDVLFGFSDFESDDFADAGYTFRASTDAAGTMRDPLIFKEGEDCYSKDFGSGRNRWGDYSHTVVDPTNDLDFWTIQEYAALQAPPVVGGSLSKWGTWWANVSATPTPTPTPDIDPAGTSVVSESCPPSNGVVDPGERVTLNFTLMNNGGAATSNLVATMQSSANVIAPSGPQNYGAIAPGGSATRPFTFTADGAPGATIPVMLQLQDGATNLGTVTFSVTLGTNSSCRIPRLVVNSTLTRDNATTVRATYMVQNVGAVTAINVMLTTAMLGSTNGTPLPQPLGNLAPGQTSAPMAVFFTNSTPGASSTLRLNGTYTGGTFTSTKRVTIP